MARRPPSQRSAPNPAPVEPPPPSVSVATRPPFWTKGRTAGAVAFLLIAQWCLAVLSLVRENPTIDEVIHLPAGISYWQTGTFKLYHHNPPLVKMLAAWPVSGRDATTEELYRSPAWTSELPNKAEFAHEFARLRAADYFELFTKARLVMPTFALIGGLAVFAWSARLFGPAGGLLSLALWCTCPNVLAHSRLITTDVAATSLGVAATYLFWSSLRRPSWWAALGLGAVLGLAQLTKFSLVVLYALWPLIWAIDVWAKGRGAGLGRSIAGAAGRGLVIVSVSVLVINLGYEFEGSFTPLGNYQFVSAPLTREREADLVLPPYRADLLVKLRSYRVNRFRGTWLGSIPVPLPAHYLLGFDNQKLEADGVPLHILNAEPPPVRAGEIRGYPVYLDGSLRSQGWRTYYLWALAYKTPDATILLAALALVAAATSRRARASLGDELSLVVVPAATFAAISFGTDINIGLRYILPIFPYAYIALGRIAPWASGFAGVGARRVACGAVAGLVALAAAGSLSVHPHYLAYFNVASGGPANGSSHLIDSNIDWGQDLINLRAWLRENDVKEPVGIAYFGQIHPNMFALRGDSFPWFLPTAKPRGLDGSPAGTPVDGPKPGLYAVSVSLVHGLPWRVYAPGRFAPYPAFADAFGYFRELKPIAQIGYSINLYRLDQADADRLARHWQAR
ncbi:glycosyltransferase family 39 protein [Isosphaeraceae bacterium EP7]